MRFTSSISGFAGTRILPDAGLQDELEAVIESNLVYMPVLEAGRRWNETTERWQGSEQAPDGMVDINMANIEAMLDQQLANAVDRVVGGENPDRALKRALNNAAMFALREIVTDTPIDTGRARSEWRVTLADGSKHSSTALGLTPEPKSESAKKRGHSARLAVWREKKAAAERDGIAAPSKPRAPGAKAKGRRKGKRPRKRGRKQS